MKNIFTLLFIVTGLYTASAQYQTISDGTFKDDAIWLTPPGNPFKLHANADSLEYYSSPAITVMIDHDVVYNGNLLFQSNTPGNLSVIIADGASLTVNGNLNSETVTLQVLNGGSLDVSGAFTTKNSGGIGGNDIIIAGDVSIGGGVNNISGTWTVSTNGTLNIDGDFDAGSLTDFNVDGTVSITGDLSLNGGNWDISSTGLVKGTGDVVGLDNVAIDNNGKFSFPAATSVTSWGGDDFDCDGSNGTGLVVFNSAAGACAFCKDGPSGCHDASNPLPVNLVYFDAKLVDNEFQFAWQTASEENNDYFTIEYSEDILSFTQLDNIDGAGDSKSVIDYEYATPAFPFEEVIYFRLKQTDYDGAYAYSKIVPVTATSSVLDVALYPNPAKTSSLLTLSYENEEPLTAQVVNSVSLSVVYNFVIENGQAVLDVSSLDNGVYYISVSSISQPFRLLVQH